MRARPAARNPGGVPVEPGRASLDAVNARGSLFSVATATLLLGGPPALAASDGADLLGKPVPAWEVSDWINSPPLTLAGLRGKVVLVRWFMSTDCPYCSATAPALNQLDQDERAKGLVVIGMYHHKHPEPLNVDQVRGWTKDFGFKFPVAVDRDWRTLQRWWLAGNRRDFTSVTFLLDKKGIVRRIHPGGTMALGTADYAAMKTTIERLLAE
jgi:thiol-disulfide isomerase/thioredoxin